MAIKRMTTNFEDKKIKGDEIEKELLSYKLLKK
jgi:hypothetical protein